jgi:hypothetical protein
MSGERSIIVGKPATDADQFWIDALGKDTPDQSITRLDNYGKWLFSLTATVGTVLTGFSLFKTESLMSGRAPWLLLPVFLFAVGLGLASFGMRPRPAEVNRHDSRGIRRYYNDLVRTRGFCLSGAGMAFGLGLFSVPLALWLSAPPPTPTVSVQFEKTDQGDTVTAKLDLAQGPPASAARLSIVGFAKGQTGPGMGMPLSLLVGVPDALGKVSLQTTAKGLKNFERYRIESSLERGGILLFRQETTVP